jgi:signal transduction histidine kinase
VQDYGPGIPKKHRTRIFEQFYQVSERTGEGFGLGLYLSKKIVQHHKGKIWVESTVGKGSTFFFSLPLTVKKSYAKSSQRITARAAEKN